LSPRDADATVGGDGDGCDRARNDDPRAGAGAGVEGVPGLVDGDVDRDQRRLQLDDEPAPPVEAVEDRTERSGHRQQVVGAPHFAESSANPRGASSTMTSSGDGPPSRLPTWRSPVIPAMA
jgi:hypothetical protein